MKTSKTFWPVFKGGVIALIIGFISLLLSYAFKPDDFFAPVNFLVGFIATIITIQIELYIGFIKNIADNKYETSRKDIDTLHGLINTLYKSVERKCTLEKCNAAMCDEKKDCFFREFIINDLRTLCEAIERINNNNEYVLNKNITYYHTIAILQIERQKINIFNVIHYIDNNEEADKYDEHFLNTLLSKKYLKTINWLFIGNLSNKKAYEYLRDINAHKGAEEIFKFYNASLKTFQDILDQKSPEVTNYISKTEPNVGIYGNEFIFTQKPDEDAGYFYRGHDVRHIERFFYELIGSNKTKCFSYDEIINKIN